METLPERTLEDFIEEVLEDNVDDFEELKLVFVVNGFTFRTPPSPNVSVPLPDTTLKMAVLWDAQGKLRWYEAVKAAGYNTLYLNDDQICHVPRICE